MYPLVFSMVPMASERGIPEKLAVILFSVPRPWPNVTPPPQDEQKGNEEKS